MDEARVEFLERLFNDYSGDDTDPVRIMALHAAGIELIAALRDAWRERDAWHGHAMEEEDAFVIHKGVSAMTERELTERAERAETEVERLGKLVKQAQDWLQMYEKDSGFLAKVEALERVRAAAEHGDIWLRVSAADPDGQIPVNIAWFTNLRRVLDACHETQR